MPTVTGSSIISRAQTILLDASGVRYGSSELLNWLNDGIRETVTLRPDAYTKLVSVQLTSGTRQSIPDADGVMLMDLVRNMGANGATPGNAIRKAPREVLDAARPDWHASTAKSVVESYVYDPMLPRTFFVYPPSVGNVYVELLYSAFPPDLSSPSDVIGINDVFRIPLVDYVCYRAFSKDSEYPGNAERAVAHRGAFEDFLGRKAQADLSNVKKAEVAG